MHTKRQSHWSYWTSPRSLTSTAIAAIAIVNAPVHTCSRACNILSMIPTVIRRASETSCDVCHVRRANCVWTRMRPRMSSAIISSPMSSTWRQFRGKSHHISHRISQETTINHLISYCLAVRLNRCSYIIMINRQRRHGSFVSQFGMFTSYHISNNAGVVEYLRNFIVADTLFRK